MQGQLRLPRLTGFVRKLIITLFAAYVIELILRLQGVDLAPWLALQPGGPGVWQVATYVIVQGHSPPLWFLFGLLILWWVVSPFEVGFGARRTAQLCGVCTLGAGAVAYLAGFVIQPLPAYAGSGSLWLGAIMATTYLRRDQELSLFGAFSLTGRQLMFGLIALVVLNFLFDRNLTHFLADAGAMAAGVGFIRWLRRPRSPARTPKRPRSKDRGLRVIKGGMSEDDEPPTWLN
ncbi:MAG: hypothetical protein OXU20_38020 [Myxococcales bacterium]|nr:hypothetical protein [Myxococcales bacterium]MDD9970100.1 hypothetical protein [Myxococcales bacterium]